MHAFEPMPRAHDRALRALARKVGLLAGVTPRNAAAERQRLLAEFGAGHPTVPRWTYGPAPDEALRAAAERLAEDAGHDPDPVAALVRARAQELALELDLLAHVGQPEFGALAAQRFRTPAPVVDALADRFRADRTAEEAHDCSSDGPEPTSLASRIRALVGELRLPFRVEVRRELVPMAATGEDVVLVAAGRRLSARSAMRTALHEVCGHALPRARAATLALGLFAAGTAGGIDEQEGFALVLEERAGFLGGARARELAARHVAVRTMRSGAEFPETVGVLVRDHGMAIEAAVRTAERAYRGGDGVHAGLGREAVYLSSFVRVRTHLEENPRDEIVIASGQVSVDAAPVLREYV